jgi:electron transfer flavoprotein beta subunit
MKVLAAIKHIPREGEVRVSSSVTPVVNLEEGRMNPLGRKALEAGLNLAKGEPGVAVIAASLGPPEAEPTLREALAMGADRALLVTDPLLEDSDGLATAKALAAVVRRLGDVDAVVAGARTEDRFAGHVGPAMAALLGWPVATHGRSARVTDEGVCFEKVLTDGRVAEITIEPPCLLSMGDRAPSARHATSWGVGAAYQDGTLERWGLEDLDVAKDEVGPSAHTTTRRDIRPVPEKERDPEVLTGEPDEAAESLARRLASRGLIS